MARLRFNDISSFGLSNPVTLTLNGTTATWPSSPAFPTIASPDYALIVVEPDTVNEEIIQIAAFTSGATTATVVRNFEATNGGPNAAPAHTSVAWVHSPTAADYGGGFGIFGDGSDGSPTFDGTTTILGMAPSSNVYTVTRDLYLASPTVNSGVTLNTASFRVGWNGTMTNNGRISCNGGSGAGFNAGAGAGSGGGNGTIAGNIPSPGGNGGNPNVGSNGSNLTADPAFGAVGGAGGTGVSAGGNPGTLTAATFTSKSSLRAVPYSVMANAQGAGGLTKSLGGTGGGGGGGDGTKLGGGGGGNGGVCCLIGRAFSGTGVVQARGGNGGNGDQTSATGTGGGGGGGGGLVLITSAAITAGAITGQTIDANGGSGGLGHGTVGVNGSAGSNGLVILVPN